MLDLAKAKELYNQDYSYEQMAHIIEDIDRRVPRACEKLEPEYLYACSNKREALWPQKHYQSKGFKARVVVKTTYEIKGFKTYSVDNFNLEISGWAE